VLAESARCRGAQTTAAESLPACCAKRATARIAPHTPTDGWRSDGCGRNCQIVATSPSITKSTASPSTDVAGYAMARVGDSSSALMLIESAHNAFLSEREHGPPVDWVVVLHCFRI